MLIQQWLNKIDSIGNLYAWDERAKIFCMIGRLTGNARSWYDCQSDINYSWEQWKAKLLKAFPAAQGIAVKLKDLLLLNVKQVMMSSHFTILNYNWESIAIYRIM